MPTIKRLDERMTVNIESWKKEKIKAIAKDERRSESDFILSAVNNMLREKYGIDNDA